MTNDTYAMMREVQRTIDNLSGMLHNLLNEARSSESRDASTYAMMYNQAQVQARTMATLLKDGNTHAH